MVVPRCTEIYAYCLGNFANRVDSLYAAVQKAHEAGEEAPELSNKLVETLMRYGKNHTNGKPLDHHKLIEW